ncbi:hypothetical protein [Altererythrobacter sp. Z27]|uniref:hypothetical protein n=1 Tax=Altererythrobacter sp. Z27 TaxID=3461147 RepID=UPI00404451F3
MRRAIAMIVCVGMIGGCATVQTSERQLSAVEPGLTYFLPKREAKLSAERKLLNEAELTKALATKKAELEKANGEVKRIDGEVKLETRRLADAAVQANEQAKREIAARLAVLASDLGAAKQAQAKATGEVDSLEASLLALRTAPKGSCAFSYSAKLELMELSPDRDWIFIADPAHNPFRDDETKLVITMDGLLSSANVVAADRTGDIIVEAASAIASFGTAIPGGIEAFGQTEEEVAEDCQRPTKFSLRFDPGKGESLAWLNLELARSKYPFRVEVAGSSAAQVDSSDLSQAGQQGALFYRSALPVTITLRQCRSGVACSASSSDSDPIDAALVMLPQAGPISHIPMRSSAFVKTTNDVLFENGMITSWTANRPSEVLEVVRLPVRIAKSIVSVPAEIFQLRVNLSDQQKGLAESQKAQIEAQARLLEIKTCVTTAGEDNTAALACFAD